MQTATLNAHWYAKSGVIECPTCEGQGSRWNGRGMGGNDPDSWDIDCTDCDGIGHHACKVCGFDIQVPGYDCAACDAVQSFPAHLLTAATLVELIPAITRAFNVADIPHLRPITAQIADVMDEAQFPEMAKARAHYAAMTPERRAELEQQP